MTWPGLEKEALYEGEGLAITIDYRDIITEIVEKRVGNPDASAAFTYSSYRPKSYGITT